MRQQICGFLFAATLVAVPVTAGDVDSGLKPGDTAAAFHVEDVTGPRSGNSLCYACAYGKHRVVNIQTTKMSQQLVRLIKQLDGMVDPPESIKGESVHAFVVLLTEDPDIAIEELQKIASEQKLKNIPLTIYDELTGPPPYQISGDAEVTVMMWNQTKVSKNHAFAPDKLDEAGAAAVLRDAKQHLGK